MRTATVHVSQISLEGQHTRTEFNAFGSVVEKLYEEWRQSVASIQIWQKSVAVNADENFWKRDILQKCKTKLERGPMPNVMVALPNIGGALCSTPQSLADAHY